jgi:hypothetical protein
MSVQAADFSSDARVAVRPFVEYREGESVTIGDPGRGVFVSIPVEGVEILRMLGAGQTVGEAACSFARAHGETADMDDFLAALAAQGFLTRWDDAAGPPAPTTPKAPAVGRRRVALGRRVFGVPALAGYGAVVGVGVALVASDPGVIPGPKVLVFHQHVAAMLAALVAIRLVAVLVHEIGHMLAAWACGVPARIRAGHRLWFLVAETDMTGVWLAPKRSRYLAFLAGAIIDAVSAAVLIAVVWANRRGWVALSPLFAQFARAVLFEYLLGLLWQCCVFMRTDFYYVLATALDCKRLLADTEDLARNWLARRRGRRPAIDQSAIPSAEMRGIHAYLAIWLGGRLLALASLALVTLPVLAGYVTQVTNTATGANPHNNTIDILTIAAIGLAFQGGGLLTWIISLYRKRSKAT